MESIADELAAPGGVAAVDRALSLLCAFKEGDLSLSLAELAERTRLYKSTVLRLLASLEHGGWVQRLDDGEALQGVELPHFEQRLQRLHGLPQRFAIKGAGSL